MFREIRLGNENSDLLIIQASEEREEEMLKEEVRILQENGRDVFLIGVYVEEWNRDLSPWKMKAVFGKDDFGGEAEKTLAYIEENIVKKYPQKKIILGGYSLAGLFALWAGYRSSSFQGIAGVSPSVWFEGWDSFIRENEMQADHIYLSLGDREAKTRNPVMSRAQERIEMQYESLKEKKDCILQYNPGNHFVDGEKRCARGYLWLSENLK